VGPQTTIPRAILVALGLVLVIYAAVALTALLAVSQLLAVSCGKNLDQLGAALQQSLQGGQVDRGDHVELLFREWAIRGEGQ
jgi:amino acid transporter